MLIKKGKTNWKYLLIVFILAANAGAGILWLTTKQTTILNEFPQVKNTIKHTPVVNDLSQIKKLIIEKRGEEENDEISEIKKENGEWKQRKKNAIQRGINFLLTTDEKFIAGSSWMVKRLSERCKNEMLDKLWREKADEDLGRTTYFLPLYDPNAPDIELSELNGVMGTDRLLVKAIYCGNFSYKSILKEINLFERDGLSNSTHILLALLMMIERDCYTDLLIPLVIELANELTIAQNKADEEKIEDLCSSPSFIDIYAQRAAFIGAATFPIKEVWIEKIISCQKPDGGWFGTHPTGLSLAAIIQSMEDTESCE